MLASDGLLANVSDGREAQKSIETRLDLSVMGRGRTRLPLSPARKCDHSHRYTAARHFGGKDQADWADPATCKGR